MHQMISKDEKVFKIISYQGNPNHSPSEILTMLLKDKSVKEEDSEGSEDTLLG